MNSSMIFEGKVLMARRNIFDILEEEVDLKNEIIKIDNLMRENSINSYALEEIFDEYCLESWKNRGRYIGAEDIRKKLGITIFDVRRGLRGDKILFYLEYVGNLIWLCNRWLENQDKDIDKEYVYLQENVLSLIGNLNYELKVFEEYEKVLLVEKNAEATAVAEIADMEISYEIIEYNHYMLKGDIIKKKKILLALADKFEPLRNDLKKIDKELESNIGYLLNKMNIRHNNLEGKNAIKYVISMDDKELEEWYDETYQMILLAFLECENIERNIKVTNLKKVLNL